MKELSEQADALTGSPGAFFAFFATLVREGAAHRGLAEALGGAGFDVDAAAAQAGCDVTARLRALLVSAQESGEVRPDITYPDVKALMAGCLSADPSDPASLDRLVAVVSGGLRPAAR
ncbi:hypothetical protein [Herbidospora cretacea]|uniref:SbtR family transcriptional regulator n=1 Tax=Herbidospora cretacea TaxID=28444 RepID=UPI00077428E9|nr:hypothetical protein [Herbidospora cretacea]